MNRGEDQEFRKSAGAGPLNPSNAPPRGLWEQEAVRKGGKAVSLCPFSRSKRAKGEREKTLPLRPRREGSQKTRSKTALPYGGTQEAHLVMVTTPR